LWIRIISIMALGWLATIILVGVGFIFDVPAIVSVSRFLAPLVAIVLGIYMIRNRKKAIDADEHVFFGRKSSFFIVAGCMCIIWAVGAIIIIL